MPRKPVRKSRKLQKKRSKGFSWKSLTRSKKTQRKIRKITTALALGVASLAFLGGLSMYRSFNVASVSADSIQSYSVEHDELVVFPLISVKSFDSSPTKLTSINLIMLDKRNKKVVSHRVSLAKEIDVPGRFGVEPYQNVLALGMGGTEDIGQGAIFLNNTLQKDFGISVDKYLLVEDDLLGVLKSFLTVGQGSGLSLEIVKKLSTSAQTDFDLSALHDVYGFVDSLPADRFFVVEKLDDDYIRDINFDSEISLERKSVAILNGSGVTGVANFAARVLQNEGGRAVAVGNATKIYDKSILITDSTESFTVKLLARFFRVGNIIDKGKAKELDLNEDEIFRSDVTLILGLDTAINL